MTRVEVEDIAGIVALRRSLSEERSLRDALVALSGQLTPRMQEISNDSVYCIVLDLTGTERLIGSPIEVARQLQQRLKILNIEAAFCASSHVQTALGNSEDSSQ